MFDQFTFQLKQIIYFTFIKDYNNNSKYLETYIGIDNSNASANDKIKELEQLKHKNIDFVIVKFNSYLAIQNSLEQENNKEHVKEVET